MNNDSLICFQSSKEHLQTISSVPAAVGSAVKIRQTGLLRSSVTLNLGHNSLFKESQCETQDLFFGGVVGMGFSIGGLEATPGTVWAG